jgi:protein-S-isoprenylcysteine O-methyltransferase Ste14
MNWLEARVPPPVISVAIAVVMWATTFFSPEFRLPGRNLYWALLLLITGVACSASGVRQFRRARTTLSPLTPAAASLLVSSGIYRLTRNPMYLGMLLVLGAWAVFLASVWALVGPLCFVLYMNRFQIAPEERALEFLFSDDYLAYKSRVRRWL